MRSDAPLVSKPLADMLPGDKARGECGENSDPTISGVMSGVKGCLEVSESLRPGRIIGDPAELASPELVLGTGGIRADSIGPNLGDLSMLVAMDNIN